MCKNLKQKIKDYRLDFQGRKIPLGVGCAWLGREESYLDTVDHDTKLLLKCYETGFRYFDTSRSYGNSEQAVGAFVKEVDRNTIFLATKSVYRNVDGHKNALENFKSNFYKSFERLNTDHIDLFQIHDTNCYDICVQEAIPFLNERRKEGMIDYIGLGTRSQTAHSQAIVSGDVDSALSYLDYNLLKKSAVNTIEYARQEDVAFINSSVLMFGLIKSRNPLELEKPLYGLELKRRQFAEEMRHMCDEMNIDIVAASLQLSLLNPNIDLTLNGIKSLSNLESTIKSLNVHIFPEQWAAIEHLQGRCKNLYIEDEVC